MESSQPIIPEQQQPLFTVNAHVFQVNPETNKSWVAVSHSAVPASISHDANNIYRIIALNENQMILSSQITAEMNFTKTSQTFGQWMDSKTNIVYGLGFATESDFDKFVDKFDEVKELVRIETLNSEQINLFSVNEIVTPRNLSIGTPLTVGNMSIKSDSIYQQLREENEKLKITLQQSIRTASKVEIEIDALKTNNAYLTSRLEECTQTMEEWKSQLDFFTDENRRLKNQFQDAETVGKQQMNTELIDEIELLRHQLEDSKNEIEEKSEEIKVLNEMLAEYNTAKESAARLQSAFQRLKMDHDAFLEKNNEETKVLENLNSQVRSKLMEIQELQDKVMNL